MVINFRGTDYGNCGAFYRRTDVLWLDYSHDSNYAGQYDWFRNIYHLNGVGAEVSDMQLFEDIENALSQ